MKRLFRLYGSFLRFSFAQFFIYRANALFGTLFQSSLWIFFNLFSMYLVTLKTGAVFGWTVGELILISCVYNFFIGVFGFFFVRGLNDFSELVNSGKLDLFLVKPIDSQLYVSVNSADIKALLRLIIAPILIVAISAIYSISIQPINILFFVVCICLGAVLLYSCLFIINTCVIWATTMDNVSDLFYSLRSMGRYPRDTFTKFSHLFFVFISPFVMVISTPTRMLLGRGTVYDFFELLAVTVSAFVCARLFWKFALRHYTSASS